MQCRAWKHVYVGMLMEARHAVSVPFVLTNLKISLNHNLTINVE